MDDGAIPESEREVDETSGPFCRHWTDLGGGECERQCAECGHVCGDHVPPGGDLKGERCIADGGCECKTWKEAQ